MGNADKTARETARFLDNLTEFIAGEEQQLDEIVDTHLGQRRFAIAHELGHLE